MASVNSPIRSFLKPIVYKLFGKQVYFWLQVYGKIKDIRNNLVVEKEAELLPYFINKDDEVIDIGANYGYYAVPLSKMVKDGTVYAFEPIPFTYKVCKKILKYFGCKNVKLFQKGVGSTKERVTFNVPVQEFGAISAGQAHFSGRNNDNDELGSEIYSFKKHEKVSCDVVRIDDFLLPQLKSLTFIKMDIEGAEFFALQGMIKTITKFSPVILIEISPFFLKGFNIEQRQLAEIFENLNYKFLNYNEETKKLNYCQEPFKESNYILIPDKAIQKYRDLIAN